MKSKHSTAGRRWHGTGANLLWLNAFATRRFIILACLPGSLIPLLRHLHSACYLLPFLPRLRLMNDTFVFCYATRGRPQQCFFAFGDACSLPACPKHRLHVVSVARAFYSNGRCGSASCSDVLPPSQRTTWFAAFWRFFSMSVQFSNVTVPPLCRRSRRSLLFTVHSSPYSRVNSIDISLRRVHTQLL